MILKYLNSDWIIEDFKFKDVTETIDQKIYNEVKEKYKFYWKRML
jgi:hypothetical protein